MIKTVTLNPAVDKTVEINNFRVGEVNRISSIRLDAGGKGINVAKTIKALGGSSIATGFLAGRNGDYIKDSLNRMQVSNDFLFVKGETRTNLKIVDRGNQTNTDINEPGLIEVTEEDLCQLEDKIFSDMSKDNILVLSGSVPANVPTGIYREWTERANRSGIRVLLDADRELLEEGIKARPHLVKPNLAELEILLNRKLNHKNEIVSAGRSLLDMGIETAVISLGSDGAVFFHGEHVIYVEGLKVTVKSTVGAGDAMVAALAYAISRDNPFEKAVSLSVAAGTANVASEGTQPPNMKDVLHYEAQIHLKYL
ncbi:1-phosphofructokinase [Sinanaerobacter chloroacetimidivorans]|uniref:Tagatose-6-phosphate kinase n=1 Tax=Sinanaerobacter chloroacetimidivorans TaxID=2818044 RepID=A0A8J8AZS4_9FIRM|nr:1-phosphofructokinase [Sinanaerobacter chloroacetimidivorans]MBR0596484.1 1-phosphofructokinase [Sinanaerobacter chloroacetimidivorans]